VTKEPPQKHVPGDGVVLLSGGSLLQQSRNRPSSVGQQSPKSAAQRGCAVHAAAVVSSSSSCCSVRTAGSCGGSAAAAATAAVRVVFGVVVVVVAMVFGVFKSITRTKIWNTGLYSLSTLGHDTKRLSQNRSALGRWEYSPNVTTAFLGFSVSSRLWNWSANSEMHMHAHHLVLPSCSS
jgi:hypothetical protein